MFSANNKRPVNLDLRTIRLPIGGIVSILHRISGVLLVLAIPALLYLLQLSLVSAESFARLADAIQSMPGRVGIVLTVTILMHHLVAGLRHLMLDLNVGISRDAARRSAWWVASLTGIGAIGTAWWLI